MERPDWFRCDSGFARKTQRVRLPSIVRRVLADWPEVGKEERGKLERLAVSLERDESIEEVPGKGLDLPWGQPWSSLPFLHCEVLFYFALLDAWGFFAAGHANCRKDPFERQKQQSKAACEQAMRERLEGEKVEVETLEEGLLASFWGNKTDLSLHSLAEARLEKSGEMATILVNDLAQLTGHIERCLGPLSRVDVVVDNYAFELFNDLMLCRWLLRNRACREIHIHCKAFPIFVSDATRLDVCDMLLHAGVSHLPIVVESHPYWNSQHEWFSQMPADLSASLAAADLCIVKGDANYRKLVGERRYPSSFSFASAVSYFPCSAVAALRGIKCELVVGVPEEVAAAQRPSPGWTNDGSRGVIQFAKLKV